MFESKDIKRLIKIGIIMGILACCGLVAIGMFAIGNLPPGSNDFLLIIGIFLTLISLILACFCFYGSKTPGGIPTIEPCDYFNELKIFCLVNFVDDQWVVLKEDPAGVPMGAEMVAIRHSDFQPGDRLIIERLFKGNRIVGKVTTIKLMAMRVTSGYVFTLVPNSDTKN